MDSNNRRVGNNDGRSSISQTSEHRLKKWRSRHSRFRKVWECVVFIISLLSVFILPFNFAFGEKFDVVSFHVLDFAVDCFYFADFILRFWYFYCENEAGVVTNPKDIALQYIRSWRCLFDFFSFFPLSTLQYLFLHTKTFQSKMPNFARCANLFYCFRELQHYLQQTHGAFNSAKISVMKVIFAMLICLNSFGCALLRIGYMDNDGSSWLTQNRFDKLTFNEQIIRSYYLVAQALFTVGYGELKFTRLIEISFISFVMLSGVFMYALLIAIMTSVIANQDSTGMEYKKKINQIQKMLSRLNVSNDLRDRLELFLDYLNQRQGAKLEKDLLGMLTTSLSQQISMLHRSFIVSAPLFKHEYRKGAFINAILRAFEPRTYSPNSKIIYSSTLQPELFIIRKGRVNVLSSSGITVTTILVTDVFGDFEMLFNTKHRHTYSSVAFCDVLVLDRTSFFKTLKQHNYDNFFEHISLVDQFFENYLANRINERPENDNVSTFSIYDEIIDKILSMKSSVNAKEVSLAPTLNEESVIDCGIHKTITSYKLRLEKYGKQLSVLEKNLECGRKRRQMFGDEVQMHRKSKSNFALRQRKSTFDTIPTYSKLVLYWNIIVLVTIIIYAFWIPVHIKHAATNDSLMDFSIVLVIPYTLDLVFYLDIVLNMLFFEYDEANEEGELHSIRERNFICKKYITSSRFVVDCLSSAPYSIFANVSGYYVLYILPRLIKILFIGNYVNRIIQGFESLGVRVTVTTATAIKLSLVFSIVTIFSSCLWALFQHRNDEDSSLLSAVYWSLITMTTIGYGDVTPTTNGAMTYTIVVIVLGTSLSAAAVGNIAAIFNNSVVSPDSFDHRQSCCRQFFLDLKLPDYILAQCDRYFSYCAQRFKGIDEGRLLRNSLPLPIRQELIDFLHLNIVSSALVFQICLRSESQGFLRTIARLLIEEFVSPGEYIFELECSYEGMFFLQDGDVRLTKAIGSARKKNRRNSFTMLSRARFSATSQNPDDVLHEVKVFPGETFHEYALYDPKALQYNAYANTQCLVYILHTKDFNKLQYTYPKVYSHLRSTTKRLSEEKWEIGSTFNECGSAYSTSSSGISSKGKFPSEHTSIRNKPFIAFLFQLFSRNRKLLPHSSFLLKWHSWLFCILVVNIVIIPLGMSFQFQFMVSPALKSLLILMDCCFGLDIYFNISKGAFISTNRLIVSSKLNFEKYLFGEDYCMNPNKEKLSKCKKIMLFLVKGHFFTDIIAAVPLDLIVFINSLSENDKKPHYYTSYLLDLSQCFYLARGLKLFRNRYLFKYMDAFGKLFGNQLHGNSIRQIKLFCWLFLTCHYAGSLWFFIALPNIKLSNISPELKTKHWAIDHSQSSPFGQYIVAVYWACYTLTTVGYGDILPANDLEYIYTVFVVIFSTLAFTLVISGLQEIVAQLDVTSTLYQQNIDSVKKYMAYRALPGQIQDQVLSSLSTLWLKNKGVSGEEALTMASDRVRRNALNHMCFQFLHDSILFKNCSQQFMAQLINVMHSESYRMNDVIFTKDSCALQLHILIKGTVDFLSDSSTSLFQAPAPHLISIGEFIKKDLRGFTCQAKTYVNMLVLSQEDFEKILDYFPEQKDIIDHKMLVHDKELDTRIFIQKVENNFRNSKMAHMLTENTATEEKYIWGPNSSPKKYWGIIYFGVVLYSAVSVPFRLAFNNDVIYSFAEKGNIETFSVEHWLLLDLFSDLFNFINAYLNCFHFARFEKGILVTERKLIKASYLASGFFFDLIASFPLDLFAYFGGLRNQTILSKLRLIRLILLRYLPCCFQEVILFLEERYLHFSVGVWQAVKMFCCVILMCHWFACGFFVVAVVEGIHNTWIASLGLINVFWAKQYIYSLFWSIYTVTTVGFGNIQPRTTAERLFAIFAMLIGAVLCNAGLTAVLTNLISTVDEKAGSNVSKVECLRKYMEYRKFPLVIRRKVQSYLMYVFTNQGALNEVDMLNNLSYHSKNLILNHLCYRHMVKVPIFRVIRRGTAMFRVIQVPIFCVLGLIRSIISRMYPMVYLPRDVLVIQEEIPPRMFCVIKGYLKRKNVGAQRDGSYFISSGAVIGQFGVPSQETIQCITFCEVFCLNIDHYQECISYSSLGKKSSLQQIPECNSEKLIAPDENFFSNHHNSPWLNESSTQLDIDLIQEEKGKNMIATSVNRSDDQHSTWVADAMEKFESKGRHGLYKSEFSLVKLHLAVDLSLWIITNWNFISFLYRLSQFSENLPAARLKSAITAELIITFSLYLIPWLIQAFYTRSLSNFHLVSHFAFLFPYFVVYIFFNLSAVSLLILRMPSLLYGLEIMNYQRSIADFYQVMTYSKEMEVAAQKTMNTQHAILSLSDANSLCEAGEIENAMKVVGEQNKEGESVEVQSSQARIKLQSAVWRALYHRGTEKEIDMNCVDDDCPGIVPVVKQAYFSSKSTTFVQLFKKKSDRKMSRSTGRASSFQLFKSRSKQKIYSADKKEDEVVVEQVEEDIE